MSMKSIPVLAAICCGPESPPVSGEEAAAVAARFKALSDPTRVAIVSCLSAADEVCVCNLTESFELSQPTISHHLKILRDAGLVESSRRGTWAYYRLVPEAIGALRAALGAVDQPAAIRATPASVSTIPSS
jgi:ArsR family transcriptional regulator, arsenate/arsenite/antimonite-responsive transcriptional repressor